MNTENPICTNCGHRRLAHRIDGTCPMKGQPTKEVWACSQYMEPPTPPEWQPGDEVGSESDRSYILRYDGPGETESIFKGTCLNPGRTSLETGASLACFDRRYFTFRRRPTPEEPKPEVWEAGDILRTKPGRINFMVRFHGMTESGSASFRGTIVDKGDSNWTPLETWNSFDSMLFTLHRRPTPEERAKAERIAANAKLESEWKKEKFIVQISDRERNWMDLRFPVWDCMDISDYRRKPVPQYVPWSFEDDLLEMRVKSNKQGLTHCRARISAQDETYVAIGTRRYSYSELFHDFTQLDGTPCGRIAP